MENMKTAEEIPRRNYVNKQTITEVAISKCIGLIEELGADERLTKAQTLINEAFNLVADYEDEQIFIRWLQSDEGQKSINEALIRGEVEGKKLIESFRVMPDNWWTR